MRYEKDAPDRWHGRAQRSHRGNYSTATGQILEGLTCLALFGAIPAIMAIVGVGL